MKYFIGDLIILLFLLGCSEENAIVGSSVPSSNDKTENEEISKVIGNDPLASLQWYLENSGEKIFNYNRFKIGEDINWDYAFEEKGTGVNVVVSDGRIQLGHEDLLENADLTLSKNYTEGSLSVGEDPDTGNDDDNHGTFISGLIASVQDNSTGITGVSPSAKLIGYNYIDSTQSLSITLDNYESSVKSIFNYSYGFFNCETTQALATELRHLQTQAMSGNIYLTASGNDFFTGQDNCGGSENDNYIGNSIFNEFKNLPEMIVIGATNGVGTPTTYSTPGPNLLVSAPGGDGGAPMIGLDLEGCSAGLATSSSSKDFENGSSSLNQNCNYVMDSMMGTSFSTPLVTGASALFMEVCEDCDFRDLRHGLIKTATHRQDITWEYSHPMGLDLSGYQYHLGFVENDYGLEFNNDIGFGVLDVKGLINYASGGGEELYDRRDTVKENGVSFYQSGTVNLAIPDGSNVGVSSTISIASHNLSIEHILLKVRVNHSYISDLGMDLISPAGTRHRLTNINSEILINGDQTILIGVNGFYGEKSLGDWRLEIVDGLNNDTGTLVSWSIQFMGGKWGREQSAAPPEVESFNISENDLTWTSGFDGILRFELCLKETGVSCEELDWISVAASESTYSASKYKDDTWKNLRTGDTYNASIRIIDTNEVESSVTNLEWTVTE